MKVHKLYANNKVYAPDGVLLFIANKRRVDWYLKRDLATKTSDGIILNFNPKGNGHEKDKYHLAAKENICVVCGESQLDTLTKHHIIPQSFRIIYSTVISVNNYTNI